MQGIRHDRHPCYLRVEWALPFKYPACDCPERELTIIQPDFLADGSFVYSRFFHPGLPALQLFRQGWNLSNNFSNFWKYSMLCGIDDASFFISIPPWKISISSHSCCVWMFAVVSAVFPNPSNCRLDSAIFLQLLTFPTLTLTSKLFTLSIGKFGSVYMESPFQPLGRGGASNTHV
jgi:hypothetical protein